jgi:hypothetical protein
MDRHRAKRGAQDRARINMGEPYEINMGEPYEIEYWAKALGVSRERLAAIVEKVGDRVEAVRGEIAEQH